MTKSIRYMVVGAMVAAAAFGSFGVARADVSNSNGTNVQDGSNRSSGTQSGKSKSGDSVGGQVSGVVSSGRTSVDARNNSSNSSVESGDARGSNTAATFTGLTDSGGSTSLGTADITNVGATNLQDGDNRSSYNQSANATSGDGVAGEVIGVVTAAGGSASVVAANTTRDSDITTGDGRADNDFAAFVGLNDSGSLDIADISSSTATNAQSGNNRLTGRQIANSASGDGVGGQVLGVVSAGAASLDASNTTADSSVQTGDSNTTNDAGYFVGLNDSGTTGIADVNNVGATNLQDGNNSRTFTQSADASSGDSVAGQVSGVVTSAGGSASVVLANNSSSIDSLSGDGRFDNSDAGFVGLNDSGSLTIPAIS